MVGVPGRSKACHTCRKRKLGCDQLRPRCRQCTRSGLECGGYQRAAIFVNTTQDFDVYGCDSDRFAPATYSSTIQASYASIQTTSSSPLQDASSSPLLKQSLERTAAESKYVLLYWNFLLPNNGQAFTSRAVEYSTTGWIRVVQDLCQRHNGVRLCLLFNALALVGQRTGQASFITEAWRMYYKALPGLAQSLPQAGEPRTARTNDDELLMTSALFAAFELLQVSEGKRSWLHGMTWLRHCYGQKAIILARGPHCYVDGNAHRLFADGRLHLVYPEIHRRTRSPFNSSHWKSIPWSNISKTPKDELVDILLEIPGLLEDVDQYLAPSHANMRSGQVSLYDNLLTRCQIYDTHLQEWSMHSGAAVLTFVERQILPKTCQEFTSLPSSEEFAMAHLGLIYYATCTLLYDVSQQLVGGGTVHERTNPWVYCRKILCLVRFFQRPSMGSILINFVAFPIGVVVSFLAKNDKDRRSNVLSGEIEKSIVGVFRNQHGGSQLRAFLESWPWQHANEARLVMGR